MIPANLRFKIYGFLDVNFSFAVLSKLSSKERAKFKEFSHTVFN